MPGRVQEDWTKMSAPSFERENIGLNSPTTDSAAKPLDPAREHTGHEHTTYEHDHTWRPPA
jgi:hypothetical protein